jgi:hypothetical protein
MKDKPLVAFLDSSDSSEEPPGIASIACTINAVASIFQLPRNIIDTPYKFSIR